MASVRLLLFMPTTSHQSGYHVHRCALASCLKYIPCPQLLSTRAARRTGRLKTCLTGSRGLKRSLEASVSTLQQAVRHKSTEVSPAQHCKMPLLLGILLTSAALATLRYTDSSASRVRGQNNQSHLPRFHWQEWHIPQRAGQYCRMPTCPPAWHALQQLLW